MDHNEEFSTAYAKHIDEIYRYVFFAVNQHREVAQDLTSAIFLKAWKRRKHFDPEKATFRTFIFRVARTSVIDHYRTRKPQQELTEDAVSQKHTSETVDAAFLWRSAQATLSEHAYEAMVLRYRTDLPVKEIAITMELTEDAVKSLLKRAKQQLRTELSIDL